MNRNRSALVTVACLVAAIVAGCGSPAVIQPSESSAVAEFKGQLARDGKVRFRSWNGKWIGMDGDTDLNFMPDGVVVMWEAGFTVRSYKGTYELDAEGAVSLQFEDFKSGWPAMVLERDAESLLLRPKDPKVGFIMGGRGGATTRSEHGSYWPFRVIALKQL